MSRLDDLYAQAKAFIPGVQQMFRNVGLQDQQAGRNTTVKSTIKGLAPKTTEGLSNWAAKMNPFNPSGAQAYSKGIAPSESSGSYGSGSKSSGDNSRISQLTAPGYSRNPAEDSELRALQEGGGSSESDIAQRRYEAAKNAIMGRLGMMKQEAERLRNQAKSGYDFGTGEISKNYGALKELSSQKLQQALESLGLQDTQVQNMYGRVSGNARRAMESALTRNRMLSRAMGSLGSSFYSDSQGDTTNQGMNTLNDTAIEEADKRNAIGTQKSSTSTEFAQNDVAIGAEEAQLRQAALEKYQNEVSQADMLQKNYNIDSEAAIAEANANLDSALNQIRTYALNNQGYSTKGNTYSNLTSTLPKYDAIAPVKSKLDNQENYSSANKFIADANNIGRNGNTNALIADGGQSNSLLDTIKFKANKKQQEDPNQYFLNRAYA